MEFEVKIENFEGTLETLVKLAKKQEIDLSKVVLSEISADLIDKFQSENFSLEDAGDMLIHISNLLELKSRMLLPESPKIEEAFEETVDIIKELTDDIEEYKKFKEVSEDLKKWEEVMKYFFPREGEDIKKIQDFEIGEDVSIYDLISSLKAVLHRVKEEKIEIPRETITVEKMREIILNKCSDIGIEFSKLFSEAVTKIEIIVTFLALLELIKEKLVKVRQEKQFEEIKVYKI